MIRVFAFAATLCVVAACLIGFSVFADDIPPPPPAEMFAAVYEPCAHCHQIGPGAKITTGPPLQGVVGRRVASVTGYPYSGAMKASGITWTREELDRFITSPASAIPGTRMIFAGIDDAARRKAIIEFLASPHPD